KDIRPLITGREGAVSPYAECGFFYAHKHFKPVRKGKWKYSNVWKDNRLYDLSTPEHEKRNLAKKHPEIVKELKALSEAKWEEIEKNYRPIGDLGPKKKGKR
ncbi:MAG: hypothetical protein ACYTGB_06390, partial [Planctomycetota bacterium]